MPDKPARPDDRDAILLRRRRFVISAVSGAGIALGLEGCEKKPDDPTLQPQVCLKIAEPRDPPPPASSPSPSAPASTPPSGPAPSAPAPDAGAPSAPAPDGGAPDGGKPDAGRPRPKPHPCLRVADPLLEDL